LTDKDQIDKIKMEGIATIESNKKTESIDALATYGKDGIDPIMDVINSTARTEIREYGLEKIRQIRETTK
jgi:hypothetical protein